MCFLCLCGMFCLLFCVLQGQGVWQEQDRVKAFMEDTSEVDPFRLRIKTNFDVSLHHLFLVCERGSRTFSMKAMSTSIPIAQRQ